MSWVEILEGKYQEAVKCVIREQQVSASMIQVRVRCGYKDATNFLNRMIREGIVAAEQEPTKPRKVLVKSLDEI